MPPSRLHRQFLWPLIGAVAVATLLAWLVAGWLYGQAAERRLSQQLGHAAAVLADGALPLTPGLLELLGRLLQADIALVTPAGQVGLASGASGPAFAAQLAAEAGAQRAAGGPSVAVRLAGDQVVVTAPLPEARDRRFAGIALRADLSDLRRAAGVAALWLGATAAVGLLLLSYLLHRLSLSITAPIDELARMAEAIAEGDRRVRVPVRRQDEIGALALALNRMAERLGQYEQEQARQGRLAALGEIAARIAHEVRNPLTALKLHTQLLAEDLPPALRPVAVTLSDELDRLELVVASVLTQAQGDPAALRRRPTDLDALIGATLRLFQPQFAHNGIQLQGHLGAPAQPVDLDPDRFRQVLVNLLVNARDALPEGGQVRVTTRPSADGAGVSVLVEDSGPGLTDGADGPSGKPLGLGLGLRLCRELIAAHGGTLTLAPGSLGGLGAVIELPLPQATP